MAQRIKICNKKFTVFTKKRDCRNYVHFEKLRNHQMALNQVKEENRVLIDSLSKINPSELISILQEVFRLKQIEDDEEVTRWFLVSHTSVFDKEKGFFKPENRLDPLHIAKPLHPSNEDDLFQMGICNSCGLEVNCSEKLAVCPYCGEIVMCT